MRESIMGSEEDTFLVGETIKKTEKRETIGSCQTKKK